MQEPNEDAHAVIGIHNVSNIYRVPLLLIEQNVLEVIKSRFQLNRVEKPFENFRNILQWTQLADSVDKYTDIVKIALVGKYFHLEQTSDETQIKVFTYFTYASVIKALNHAATHCERKLKILFVVSEHLENDAAEDKRKTAFKLLAEADGILVPGGFGLRGVEGKIEACKYAREMKKPFLGICLGMQCAAIEFARNICKIYGASSTEFMEDSDTSDDNSSTQNLAPKQKIVIKMLEHSGGDMGGTMRLGRRATEFLTTDSILYELYGRNQTIEARHRHRYEINPSIVPTLAAAGLRFIGMGVDQTKNNGNISDSSNLLLKIAREKIVIENEEQGFIEKVKKLCDRGSETNTAVRMEILELKNHPYLVGVQYHPEYTSHPLSPSPPFLGLLLASSGQLQDYLNKTNILTSPLNKSNDGELKKHTKFHYLPSTASAGNNISAPLMTSKNNFKQYSSAESDLKVPGVQDEENMPPVLNARRSNIKKVKIYSS
uniref:CTP synthase (glutamine hydrolyzing) n=1 Tax=Panagrolaimus sp. ES5 TaxID=591445 RepID=A0AC34GVU7_9BILA